MDFNLGGNNYDLSFIQNSVKTKTDKNSEDNNSSIKRYPVGQNNREEFKADTFEYGSGFAKDNNSGSVNEGKIPSNNCVYGPGPAEDNNSGSVNEGKIPSNNCVYGPGPAEDNNSGSVNEGKIPSNNCVYGPGPAEDNSHGFVIQDGNIPTNNYLNETSNDNDGASNIKIEDNSFTNEASSENDTSSTSTKFKFIDIKKLSE